ncbi:MAG: TonB-dependent receptor [Flavobacteriales bacterium]|nr:TonB-dependent receptor [Flavobacteriales bacterium]
MKRFIILTLIGFTGICVTAQQSTSDVKGKVVSEGKAVQYANIFIDEIKLGTATDNNGNFIIKDVPDGIYTFKVSCLGFAPFKKRIEIQKGNVKIISLELQQTHTELDEIVVTGTMKETRVSDSPVKVEILTSKFLRNNTGNNIMESIGMVNGVQEQVSCGVCGTSCIHINGMEGAYTLMLIDGMPLMSALASTYGLNGIPNEMIERIEIVKGPSSTLYGTEAVGGVINVITKNPENMEKLMVHAFGTTHAQYNLDAALTSKLSDKIITTFSTNLYNNQLGIDDNNDNFTDIPLNNRITLFNKWSFKRKDKRISNLALRYYFEDRFGGTLQWEKDDRGSEDVYGEFVKTKRYEVIGSYQLPFKEHIRFDYSFNNHFQDSWYGSTRYKASQNIFYSNLLWSKHHGKHDWIVGVTSRYQTYKDNTLSYTNENEFIPGVFAQDEYSITKKTSLLFGTRLDYHEKHGVIIAPRFNVKQKLGLYTTARLNIGTGFRQVHLFTEDHAFYSGARKVEITKNLKPEESYNANLNLNHVYSVLGGAGTLDMDVFFTHFSNKILPDYDVNPNLIVYDNLKGYALIKGVSYNIHHSFLKPLSISLGGTFMEMYQVYNDVDGNQVKEEQEFTPRFSGTIGVEYRFKKPKIVMSWSGKFYSPQKLPEYDHPFERPTRSPWYSLNNLQITKEFKNSLNLYVAVKNVFNYTQPSPLVDPENPFGENFDTAYAYGPLQTRRFMFGLRWSFNG